MFTSLYLMKVLPASMPWATLNTMVMVGPSLRMRWIAIPMATTAARIGMIQTTEIRMRLLRHDRGLREVVEIGVFSHGDLGCGLPESQIRRGSKDSAASIVSTTTAAKNSTPGPGSTDISGCSCTSATVNVSTNTSSIDQRPMNSTMR